MELRKQRDSISSSLSGFLTKDVQGLITAYVSPMLVFASGKRLIYYQFASNTKKDGWKLQLVSDIVTGLAAEGSMVNYHGNIYALNGCNSLMSLNLVQNTWSTVAEIKHELQAYWMDLIVSNDNLYCHIWGNWYQYSDITRTVQPILKPVTQARDHLVYNGKGSFLDMESNFTRVTDVVTFKESKLTNGDVTHRKPVLLPNDQILLIGGQDEAVCHSREIEVFNPKSKWQSTEVKDMTYRRSDHATIFWHSKKIVLAVAGCGCGRTVERYSVREKTWTTTRPLPLPLYNVQILLVDDEVYVFGSVPYITNDVCIPRTGGADTPSHNNIISPTPQEYLNCLVFYKYNYNRDTWHMVYKLPTDVKGGAVLLSTVI